MSAEYPHKLTRDAMDGCCGDHASRGHLCQYHEGFNDGVEMALAASEAMSAEEFLASLEESES